MSATKANARAAAPNKIKMPTAILTPDTATAEHVRVRPGETWTELEVRGKTIRGSLHEMDAAPQEFEGWLELVPILEEAHAREPRSTREIPRLSHLR